MLFEEKHNKTNYYCHLEYENINCLLHCQRSFEIVFAEKGSILAEIKNKAFTVSEGNCIWILPYETHRITTPKDSKVSIFIFSTDYISDFYDAVKRKTLKNPVSEFSDNSLDILKNNTDNRFMLKSVLYELCEKVFSGGVSEAEDRSKTDNSVKTMLYLQQHYKEQITLKSLAKELGYSYSYTSAIFKECFHSGFVDIINEFRLDEAVRLLKEKKHSVTEISELCGFATIRNFNIAFKKKFNRSPREYLRTTER